ncbi:MAG: glycerol-3-phosphate 1-O-acyltransferase PlsY [Patescibacteria group bacterium]
MNLLSIVYIALGYLVGSIPTGKILVKLVSNQDIQNIGSGNIGTTNVTRALGIKWGALVYLIDAGKAWLTLFLISPILVSTFESWAFLAGALSVLFGNLFSIFLKFKGGKGVATSFGLLCFVSPLPALILLPIFYIILKFTGKVSLGSLGCALIAVIFYWYLFGNTIGISVLCMVTLVYWAHRQNIIRLLNNTELSFKK